MTRQGAGRLSPRTGQMKATVVSESTKGPVPSSIRVCANCGGRYDWRKSTSQSLKMTYCGVLCEIAGLGFTIEGLLGLAHSGEKGQKGGHSS